MKTLEKEIETIQSNLQKKLRANDLNDNDKNYLLGKLVAYTEMRGLLSLRKERK